MKKVIFLLILFISNYLTGQNQDIQQSLYVGELANLEINEILNSSINDITENETTEELKKKLNSELNTIASIVLFYKFSEVINLSIEELKELEKRIVYIANKFYEQKKYFLFEFSSGYASIVGVKEEFISGKAIKILMMGGDCLIDEVEKKQDLIYLIFNQRMKSLIQK